MPRMPALVAVCLLLAATACTALPEHRGARTTYVVVRHAEKATDDPRDPSLSDAGRKRAAALAAALADDPVTAVYATDFRRTRDTAQPVADAHGLPVLVYDARQVADAFVAGLRRRHADGTVVVVGHGNTVPAIVSALCDCAVPEMDESDYGHRYTVRVGDDGRATLAHARD